MDRTVPKTGTEEIQPLRKRGVYLVTGGLGNIGYELAKYLAAKAEARLIITGRSLLDQKEKNGQIKKIRHLEELGANVLYFTADAADSVQMEEAVNNAEKEWGPINGVVHCAGVIGGLSFQPVQKIEKEQCMQQFRAKLYGALNLAHIFKEKKLDFCWLMSSLSSVLGGLLGVAYTAANCFVDAFIDEYNSLNPVPWISVDWESLTGEEAQEAFRRILAAGPLNRVVISKGGQLNERIQRWIKLEPTGSETPGEKGNTDEETDLHPRPELDNPYEAPRTQLEQTVAGIWQKLFGIEQVGIFDNFLDLGGDSLKAITLMARIHNKLEVEVPLAEFFDHPTVERLTQYIEKTEKSAYIPIEPAEEKEYYPLSSAQKRLFVQHSMEKNSTVYNETQVVLIEGDPDIEKLEQAFDKMMQRHDCLRTAVEIINGEPYQRIYDKIEFKPTYYETGEKEAAALVTGFIKTFDLTRAPFLRTALIKIGERRQLLVIDMHHIITDGISHQIFLNELSALYIGKHLPPITIQYKDFSQWQNRLIAAGEMKKQEEFWLEEFSGTIPVLQIPTDYPRPPEQSFDGNRFDFEIDSRDTERLRQLVKKENVTMFILLLSIYYILLAKITGQENIVVGSMISGRKQEELTHTLGVFINMLALKNTPEKEKKFRDFLMEVKNKTLKAFDNQDYQFEKLVEKVGAHKAPNRSPLLDAGFQLQDFDVAVEEIEEEKGTLAFKSYSFDKRIISKVDMTLSGVESRENIFFSVEYCSKLFKEQTIKKYMDYYRKILAMIVASPDIAIKEIEIVPDEEQQKIRMEIKKDREAIHTEFDF
ncbi:MAG: SDR family NAD(P)-dependent oxidoreductase [bacterium]|nr:SDR family NAD(P)-dependent oxidoreductase [bacterium]